MVVTMLVTLAALCVGAALGTVVAYLRIFPAWGLRLGIVAVALVALLVVPDRGALPPVPAMLAVLAGGLGGLWLGRELRARRYAVLASAAAPSE